MLAADGSLWVAWPKQLSGYATDVSAEVAQAAGLGFGLLDTRRLSLNDGWTAMRFIVRLDDRDRVEQTFVRRMTKSSYVALAGKNLQAAHGH